MVLLLAWAYIEFWRAIGELQKAVIDNPAEYARRGEGQNRSLSCPFQLRMSPSSGIQILARKETMGALKKPALGSGQEKGCSSNDQSNNRVQIHDHLNLKEQSWLQVQMSFLSDLLKLLILIILVLVVVGFNNEIKRFTRISQSSSSFLLLLLLPILHPANTQALF